MCKEINCNCVSNYANTLSFTGTDGNRSGDENKVIQKPTDYGDINLMFKEICDKIGIKIQSTEVNSHPGDFSYNKEDEQKLIDVLDSYLKD